MISLLPGLVYHSSLYFVLASFDFSLTDTITMNCLISPLSAKTLDKNLVTRLAATAAHGSMQTLEIAPPTLLEPV